jgi:TonB family protein
MFQIRVNSAEMKHLHVDNAAMNPFRIDGAMMNPLRVDGAAMKGLRVACALAFALGFALVATADSTEVAELASADSIEVAGIASAGSTEVAEIASTNPTEVAGVILSDDAMPRGPSVAARLAIIREKIQDALEYPPLAQLHDSDGDALVRFEIDRSGSAQNVRLLRSSGHVRLDTSAVRAVETASPLPWVYGPLEVPVHFELTAPR